MPEDPKAIPDRSHEESAEPPAPKDEQREDEIGDFINRHVFEKDSVFNEG